MPGVLNLTQPSHLLAKLVHEFQLLVSDPSNSYAAINAVRDAYHLREWVWHHRLEHDQALQVAVAGSSVDEAGWNAWVNACFPDFGIIRALCNGSKHFEPGQMQIDTHRPGWDSPVSFWDNPHSGWDDVSFHVQIDGGRMVAVMDLLPRVRDFWKNLFDQFQQLA